MRLLVLYGTLFRAMWRALGAETVRPLLALVLLIALLGAVVFRAVEGWPLLDGFYFSIVTMATVGYGDLAPGTTLGKAAAIVLMVGGIGTFVLAITTFAHAFLREILVTEGGAALPHDDDQTRGRGGGVSSPRSARDAEDGHGATG